MLQITLNKYGYVAEEDHPILPRHHCGWNPRLTDDEVLTSARGWWRLDRSRAERERYVVVAAEGIGRLAVEVTGWDTDDKLGRHGFRGIILPAGHPVHDRYVGKPLATASQNPIHYISDPCDSGDGPCKCGCGETTRGTWVQGHDQRAIHDRIRRDFTGDVARFVDWYDQEDVAGTRSSCQEKS